MLLHVNALLTELWFNVIKYSLIPAWDILYEHNDGNTSTLD